MSWFSVGAAVVGVGISAFQASQGGPKTTQTLEFPEETRRLIGDVEFPLLAGNLREQEAFISPFLQGPAGSPFVQQRFGNLGNIVEGAARRGAKTAGVDDFGPIMDDINGLSPDLLNALRELVFQRAAQTRTVVPPGFSTFLSPSTNISQSGGSDNLQTGFQIGQGLAQIGSSFLTTPKAT